MLVLGSSEDSMSVLEELPLPPIPVPMLPKLVQQVGLQIMMLQLHSVVLIVPQWNKSVCIH